MTIADAIRKTESEEVVYLLLTSYIDAARSCDRLKSLPGQLATLPLQSTADVRSQFELLMLELDAASKRWDDDTCVVVKEALHIFSTAAHRLQILGADRRGSGIVNSRQPHPANVMTTFEQTCRALVHAAGKQTENRA